MYNDLIPDPFVNDNELNISWVSDLTWEYRCLFDVSVSQRQAYLVFDQLDTEAEVELNNEVIAQSDNAFHKHVVAVNLTLKNDLIVKLKSGVELGKSWRMSLVDVSVGMVIVVEFMFANRNFNMAGIGDQN